MADLFPSLTQGLLPKLCGQPSIVDGFNGWVLKGKNSITVDSFNRHIVFQTTDTESLIRSVAFDFERFALSGKESFSVALAEEGLHHLAGWPLLKLYYSGFFSAHAIMRSQGTGVIHLTSLASNHINSILAITSPGNPSFSPGIYTFRISRSGTDNSVSVTLEPDSSNRGVHEGFWNLFCDFISDRANQAMRSGLANSTEFFQGANELVDAIRGENKNSKSVWLSTVRNELNYQHKHNVWFPIRKPGTIAGYLKAANFSSSSSIRIDISKAKNPIGAFVSTARYLSCLNIELSDYVAARSNGGRSFGQKWRRISEHLPSNSYMGGHT